MGGAGGVGLTEVGVEGGVGVWASLATRDWLVASWCTRVRVGQRVGLGWVLSLLDLPHLEPRRHGKTVRDNQLALVLDGGLGRVAFAHHAAGLDPRRRAAAAGPHVHLELGRARLFQGGEAFVLRGR